jgi:hypothetical protein
MPGEAARGWDHSIGVMFPNHGVAMIVGDAMARSGGLR